MLKFLWLLALTVLLRSGNGTEETPPNSAILTLFGDKFKMPDASLTADNLELAGCVDDDELYGTEELLAEIDTEEEYLCAFIAFQINKVEGEGLPNYADEAEATRRYPLFKECVDYVKGLNEDHDTTEFEVNFFCDMTTEEKNPYASAGDDSGYGVGSSGRPILGAGDPDAPPDGGEIPPNQVIFDLMGDDFKLPEASAAGDLTAEDLTLAECVDANLYDSEEVVAEIDEEKEYLCAFIAFQINKVEGEGIPNYADEAEATRRYPLFKECVDYVKGLNEDHDTTEFGVNFFCDMTADEKKPYTSAGHGGDFNDDGLGFAVGSSYDGGASEVDGAVATKASFLTFTAALALTLNFVLH